MVAPFWMIFETRSSTGFVIGRVEVIVLNHLTQLHHLKPHSQARRQDIMGVIDPNFLCADLCFLSIPGPDSTLSNQEI
jgi:hypothetical protein